MKWNKIKYFKVMRTKQQNKTKGMANRKATNGKKLSKIWAKNMSSTNQNAEIICYYCSFR